MLSQITSRQFAEWLAYFNEQPFGQDFSDLVMANVGAALWNQNRGKNTDPIRSSDFLPQKQQDPEEMKLALRRAISGNR